MGISNCFQTYKNEEGVKGNMDEQVAENNIKLEMDSGIDEVTSLNISTGETKESLTFQRKC